MEKEKNIDKLYLPFFEEIPNEDKVNVLRQVLPNDFQVKYVEQHIQVFYQDKVFIFVPGCKGVELGWSLDDKIPEVILNQQKELIKSDQEEFDRIEEEEEFSERKFAEEVDQRTSPRRRVDIGPMLVEPKLRPTFRKAREHETQQYGPNPLKGLPGVIYYSPKTLKEELKFPFRLMTEDEWEYFYTGNHREFSPSVPSWIEIANDPYKFELVDSPCRVKGGDGGCCVCGGEGFAYQRLVLSPFYRDQLNYFKDFDGSPSSYNNYRLMIRVSDII
ncbi:Sulfatase-modifying factor enzyme 1 [Histomonas meleagridis]|uniref:Sulfatase-modifying factor enzyme 1 n=1 Tax=Histomonas meleagridis TaxID=135588 RepID=UPI003559AC0D|nr:Sulfatase-modifying factor enzyme 1 [Histomonas meleagridis]KAH0805936.1 Sulfatase-modifying factor enzyme 1 [Histomonas meleagridis]